jgi:maleylacetate reductase
VTVAEASPAAASEQGPAPDTIWGAGSLGQLGEVCSQVGAGHVMAVAGQSADAAVGRLPGLLGRRYLGRWSDVPAHVPAHTANLAVGSAQETHADAIVAIGGGSATGLAKIVALALRLPLIAVPTTYCGAEMTSRYLVTTGKGAETGTSPRVLPTAVIYDADLLPADQRVSATGIIALAHCLEALSYPGVPAEARDSAHEGLLLLWDSLPAIAAGAADLRCRRDALTGASMAGRAYQVAGPGLLHLLCDQAAALYHISYAVLAAILLPAVLRAHGPRAGRARTALGDLHPGVSPEQALEQFTAAVGVTTSIDQLGLRAGLTALTELVSTLPGTAPGRVTSATVGRLQAILATSGE